MNRVPVIAPLEYSSPFIPLNLLPHQRPSRQLSTKPRFNEDEHGALLFLEEANAGIMPMEYRFTIAGYIHEISNGSLKDQVLWYCSPMEFYTPAATGFGQLNTNLLKNLCFSHISMFEAFLFLSQSCIIDKEDCGPQHIGLSIQSVVADKTDINNEIQNYSALLFRLVKRGGKRFVTVLFKALQYNEWLQDQHMKSLMPNSRSDQYNPNLDAGNDENNGQGGEKKKGRPPIDPRRLGAFRQLTRRGWNDLCMAMLSIPEYLINSFLDDFYGIMDPEKILTLVNALHRCSKSNVPPRSDFLTNEAYVIMYNHKQLAYRYPYQGRFAYKLDPDEFTMHNYHEFLFPHFNDNGASHSKSRYELEVYKRLNNESRQPIPYSMLPYHVKDIGPNEEGQEVLAHDESLIPEHIRALRDMQVDPDRVTTITDSFYSKASKFGNHIALYDENVFRANTDKRYASANIKLNQEYADKSVEERLNKARIFMANAQAQACEEWEAHLGTVDANVSPSLRAINEWGINFRKKHFNLCMTRPHKNLNLSPLADLLVSMKMGIETLLKVYVLHDHIMLIFTSTQELYLGGKFHIHLLFMGDPRLGKSFAFETASELFIPATWKAVAFMTPRALTGEGADANDPNHDKISDKEIKFFEEMSADSLGIAKAMGNSATNTLTPTEQMWRIWLSTGIIEHHEMVRGEGERRVGKLTRIAARSVVNGACNFTKEALSQPSASRWGILRILATEREFHAGIQATLQRTLNEHELIQKTDFIERTRHMHYLAAKTGSMIEGKVFPLGIDMKAANIVIALLGIHGPSFGLSNLNDIRHLLRVRYQIQSLVMLGANDLLYNSELSPLRSRPHDILHTCLLKKYLCSNVEHVVIAFGKFASQFENPIVPSAITALFDFIKPAPAYDYEHVTGDLDLDRDRDRERAPTAAAKTKKIKKKGNVMAMLLQQQRDQQDQLRLEQMLQAEEEQAATAATSSSGSSRAVGATGATGGTAATAAPTVAVLPDSAFYETKLDWDKELKYISPHKTDKEACIHGLARTLLHSDKNMNPRPSQLDLENALRDLSETNLLVTDKTSPPPLYGSPVTKRLPILIVDANQLRLLKDAQTLIGANKKSGLKACFEYILNYKGAIKRDILYGASIPHLPYTYDVICIDPPPNAHTLILPQPDFFDKEIREYDNVRNSLSSLNQLQYDLEAKKIDWDIAFTAENRYQPSPHFVMNTDIDLLTTNMYNIKSNFSVKELAMKPSNNIFQHQRDLMAHSQREIVTTLPYPVNLPPYHKEKYNKHHGKPQSSRRKMDTATDLIAHERQKLLARYEPRAIRTVNVSPIEQAELERRENLVSSAFTKQTLCDLADDDDATSILLPMANEEKEYPPKQFLLLSDMKKRSDGTWTTRQTLPIVPEYKYPEQEEKSDDDEEEEEEGEEQENRKRNRSRSQSPSPAKKSRHRHKHRHRHRHNHREAQALSERSLNTSSQEY